MELGWEPNMTKSSTKIGKLAGLLDGWLDGQSGPDRLIGSKIREYTILECVGNGGMAKVYKARHDLLDQLRALKLLHPELSNEKSVKDRFRREARILSGLRCPHLVAVFEFGAFERGVLFMVMEYLEGESLMARLERAGRLSIHDAIAIAKQVAAGLAAVHERGVIHRDIAPDNILLTPEAKREVVKIIDFGIAKDLIAGGTDSTHPLKFVGKSEYCAPEQIARKEGQKLDGRSDVYSLGITLYEMLAGARPFKATGPACLGKHLAEPPAPFEKTNPEAEIPAALQDLVMRMLAKDRENRPPSMENLYMQLTAFE